MRPAPQPLPAIKPRESSRLATAATHPVHDNGEHREPYDEANKQTVTMPRDQDLTTSSDPGPAEQAVRRLGAADMNVLLRAKAIDTAAHKLMAEATENTPETTPPDRANANSRLASPPPRPARVAARSFPVSPLNRLAGRAAAGQPPNPVFDDGQATRQTVCREYVRTGRLRNK
jgi:hypothetical protein